MKINLLITSFFFLTFFAKGQEKYSVGFQGGVSSLIPSTSLMDNSLGGFNAHSSIDANAQIFFRYYLNPKTAIRPSIGIMGLSTSQEYLNSSYGRANRGIHPNLGLSLDRFFEIKSSSYGILASLGINTVFLSNNAGETRIIQSEEGVRIGAHIIPDGSGNFGSILAHDVNYSTRNTSLLWHLKPEIGFYKKIENHRISTSLIYGLALGNPLYVNDFRSISLNGDLFSSRHQFSGSFIGIQIGYEFLF